MITRQQIQQKLEALPLDGSAKITGEQLIEIFELCMNRSKDSVDLANVDNTSDLDKPISTATQTALDTLQTMLEAGGSLSPLFRKAIVNVSESTVESNSAWLGEASTFSGWGSGVGVVADFNIITMKIRSWDSNNVPTQVRVRIRENDHTGVILSEKQVDFSSVDGDKLTVSLDNTVSSSSRLWFEFVTDGRVGWFGSLNNSDGTGNAPNKYTTAKNLTGNVTSNYTGDPTRPIWVKFQLSESGIELSETGVTHFKDKLNLESFIPRIILPDTINATLGYTQQLFFRGMIEAINPYRWNIKVKGNVGGKQYPRYYEFTPTTTGNKIFTIELWDDNNELVASNSCTVYVSNPASTPATNKKILCLGDSLTSGGYWVGELKRMLTETGGNPIGLNHSNIEFIGTVDKGSGNRFEGYGGKRWSWYIEETNSGDIDVEFEMGSHDKTGDDIASFWVDSEGRNWRLETIVSSTVLSFSRSNHTNAAPASGTLTHVSGATNANDVVYTSASGGSVNPFWNSSTNELDIQNYITSNNFGTVDYVISLLTWNGMKGGRRTAADHQDLIDDAKVWIDKLHTQYPSCKVILLGIPLPSHNGGLAHNYGDATSNYGNLYDLNQTVFGLNLAYQELANDPAYASFVKFENLSAQFDSENNLPETDRPVNLRSTKTEKIGINGLHPTTEGYMQVADVVFKALNNIF